MTARSNNRQFFIVFASFVASLTMALGCLYAAMQMHMTILNGVLRWPMSTFDQTPMGRILNRFSKEIDTVDITLPMNLRSWITQFFGVIREDQ
jgi:ATP-binding cassette, subfamily C (CFTR/MRP), member 1